MSSDRTPTPRGMPNLAEDPLGGREREASPRKRAMHLGDGQCGGPRCRVREGKEVAAADTAAARRAPEWRNGAPVDETEETEPPVWQRRIQGLGPEVEPTWCTPRPARVRQERSPDGRCKYFAIATPEPPASLFDGPPPMIFPSADSPSAMDVSERDDAEDHAIAQAARGGHEAHSSDESWVDEVDGADRQREEAELEGAAYAWLVPLVDLYADSTLGEFATSAGMPTWRYLNAAAARNFGAQVAPFARDLVAGSAAAEVAFLTAPWLLLRAPKRDADDGARAGSGVAAQVHERCKRAAAGDWASLVEEFRAAARITQLKQAAADAPVPPQPAQAPTARQADSFCRLAASGQAGRAARQLLSSPVIATCPALLEALPRKIIPPEPERTARLQRYADANLAGLKSEITDDAIAELEFELTKRALTLQAHKQRGLTGWRYDTIRALAHHAKRDDWRAILRAVIFLLLGGGSTATRRFWTGASLMPLYKDTMDAGDPRPVGAPDPLYRWGAGTVMRMHLPKVAERLGEGQFAVGVSAGPETLVLAARMDAELYPGQSFVQGDIRNAYGDMERDAPLEEAAQISPLFGAVATASYAGCTTYLLPGAPAFTTDKGAIQGCPLGMALYCLATRRPVAWAQTILNEVAEGRGAGVTGHAELADMPDEARGLAAECVRLHTIQGAIEGAVRTRTFADNALFRVPRGVEGMVPPIAQICLATRGLQYKPKAWEAWSPTPGLTTLPGVISVAHAPADGMVVIGGALGPLDVVGVLGGESAIAARLTRIRDAVQAFVDKLVAVPDVAAYAHIAQRHVLQALYRCLRQRVMHVGRVYDPTVAESLLDFVDKELRRATGATLGWSSDELSEAWPQAQLAPEHGGMGAHPLAPRAPFYRIAGALAATATGRLPLPPQAKHAPAACWASLATSMGTHIRDLYARCCQANPTLPGTLDGLQARVTGMEADTSAFRRFFTPRGPRWTAILTEGMDDAAREQWEQRATRPQRARRSVLGRGDWVFLEPPRSRYSRVVWLVAARLWFGLDISPAIPDASQMSAQCGNIGGKPRTRCKVQLDAKGRHAGMCRLGGSPIVRHNLVRDVLGYALQGLVSGVWWERTMEELEREDGEEARLDLFVEDPLCAAMLDIVVFYPLRPDGVQTYKHKDHEKKKFEKYKTVKDGRRLTALPLIPVVLNIFGQLNDAAASYFDAVQKMAAKRGRRFRAVPSGPRSLAELVSLYAVLASASIVVHAHSHRKGDVDVPHGPGEAGAGEPGEHGADPAEEAVHSAQRCTTCHRFRVLPELPITCDKCIRGLTCHKVHDKATQGGGRAPSCKLGRCGVSCAGRKQGEEG